MKRRREVEVPVHLKVALDVVEAAAMVGLGESSVRRLVEAGELAKIPFAGRTLIARAELDRWATSTMRVAS